MDEEDALPDENSLQLHLNSIPLNLNSVTAENDVEFSDDEEEEEDETSELIFPSVKSFIR